MPRVQFVNKQTKKSVNQEVNVNELRKVDQRLENKRELNKLVKDESKGIVKGMKIEEKKEQSEEKEKKKKPKIKNSEIINQVSKLILKDILTENEQKELSNQPELTGSGIAIE